VTPTLSVCLPTYNRAERLRDALDALEAQHAAGARFELCVCDNGSTDATPRVLAEAAGRFPLKWRRGGRNRGVARNILDVVAMAEGEFCWLVGDDDLVLPGAVAALNALAAAHPEADHFFVNSARLPLEWTRDRPRPLDLTALPPDLTLCSPRAQAGPLPFLDLIDPDVSFDFLMGMFLSVFRRRLWSENLDALEPAKVDDPRVFAHFDNTCPHVAVFAKALSGRRSYFHPAPLTASLAGAREWSPLYPLVKSVRIPECLDHYRAHGLDPARYRRCRNAALDTLLPDLANMALNRDRSGWNYVDAGRLLASAAPYPGAWLSPAYYIARKLGRMVRS
jgi:glycosyltransferase involved in cell wall biosynthesis